MLFVFYTMNESFCDVLTRMAVQTPCFCASKDAVCGGFYAFLHRISGRRRGFLYSCVYISHIRADVGVTVWNAAYVAKSRWRGRIQQWRRCKCTVIYHAVYEQSTTHWFLYKPSHISCSIIMAVCYRVWRFCTTIRCFFFVFTHIYSLSWLYADADSSLRSFALHYTLILWIVVLIMSDCVKDASASSCMAYFVKA